MNLTSLQDLQTWLADKQIDSTLWGQLEGTKTIHHLWAEMVAGETVLQDNPPLRLVQAVEIIIYQGERILVEVAQEMEGGGMRPRHYPPSEKIKRGETYQQAAIRGLQEELHVSPTAVILHPETYRQHQQQIPSASYPGLDTRYHIHSITVEVAGLPPHDFTTTEASDHPHDPVTRHHWAWKNR